MSKSDLFDELYRAQEDMRHYGYNSSTDDEEEKKRCRILKYVIFVAHNYIDKIKKILAK